MSFRADKPFYPRFTRERETQQIETVKLIPNVKSTAPVSMNKAHLKSSIRKFQEISLIPNKVVVSSIEKHKNKQRFRFVQYDVDKYSKSSFNKFKKIIYHKDMNLTLCLKICHKIILNSFNSDTLYNLTESPKFDQLSDLVNINVSNTSVELSQRYFYKSQEKSYKKCWVVQMNGIITDNPKTHCLSRLIQYMNSHEMKFKSIIVSDKLDSDEHEIIYDARYDYSDFSIQKLACATQSLIYSINTNSIPSNWLSTLITSLQIQLNTNITNIETFPNLNEVILIVTELLNLKTIEKILQILTYRPKLAILKVKFKALSYDNTLMTALNDLQDYFDTNIELYLDKSTDDKKSYTLSTIKVDSIYYSLYSAKCLFRSVDLPLELTLLNQLYDFKNLTKLIVNVMPNYNGFWMQLQSSTIKTLTLIGSEYKQQKLVKLDLRQLTNLRSLSCLSCRIDSTTIETLPKSLGSLSLISTHIHNPVIIPSHLRNFKLVNSFPIIDWSTTRDYIPRLKVDLTWYTANSSEYEISNLINSLGYFIDEITLRSIGYVPNYITLVSSFRTLSLSSTSSKTLGFGIIFSEDVSEYGNLLTELEFKVINTAEEVCELLSDLALACIKSFQKEKTESVRGVIVKSAPVERFEDILVKALKSQFAGTACSLETLNIVKILN